MSQDATNSYDDADDPSLSPLTGRPPPFFDQQPNTKHEFFAPYNPNSAYNTPSSTGCIDAYDGFNLDSPYGTSDDPGGSNPGALSTPDFTGFSFEPGMCLTLQQPFTYPPTPTPDTPHPYPIQQQQQQQAQQHVPFHILDCQPSSYRPVLVGSAPDNGQMPPLSLQNIPLQNRTNQPFHRRSLSQGDAERIAAANPHFFRVQHARPQIRRANTATPEDSSKRNSARMGPYHRGPKHSHHGNKNIMRSNAPTSAPLGVPEAVMQESRPTFSRSWTTIGTPLGTVGKANCAPVPTYEVEGAYGTRIQLTGPRFRYMSHEEQMRESSKIIEIGAMAVVSKQAGQRAPPEDKGMAKSSDDVLRMVDQMEKQLKLQELVDTEKGIRGCEMIREALTEKGPTAEGMRDEKADGTAKTRDDCSESGDFINPDVAPSGLLSDAEKGMCMGSAGGDNLFTLLKKDLQANGFGGDDV